MPSVCDNLRYAKLLTGSVLKKLFDTGYIEACVTKIDAADPQIVVTIRDISTLIYDRSKLICISVCIGE